MKLLKTPHGSFIPSTARDNKEVIRDRLYVFFDYIEVFATFLLGAVLVTGIAIQAARMLTVKRAELTKIEQAKPVFKHNRRSKRIGLPKK